MACPSFVLCWGLPWCLLVTIYSITEGSQLLLFEEKPRMSWCERLQSRSRVLYYEVALEFLSVFRPRHLVQEKGTRPLPYSPTRATLP